MSKTLPKAFIFDLDGTIYLEDVLISGAKKVLEWVRRKKVQVRFLTNNPRYSSLFYANKLNNLGIEALEEEVITSAQLSADYIKNNPGYGNVFVIGEEQIKRELDLKGVIRNDNNRPDTVLVSFDTTLTYEKLQFAYQTLRKGAYFIASNQDAVCPTIQGGLVDSGAIISALEKASGKKVERVLGKPSLLAANIIVNQLQVHPNECVVVGDRLNTDIALGKRAGMGTIWISNDKVEQFNSSNHVPDYIIETIKELPKIYG